MYTVLTAEQLPAFQRTVSLKCWHDDPSNRQ